MPDQHDDVKYYLPYRFVITDIDQWRPFTHSDHFRPSGLANPPQWVMGLRQFKELGAKPGVMPSEQDLHAFIRATFRSVWAIELLCHLRTRRDQQLEPAEIVAALRASDLVVEHGLADLAASGLVVADEAGRVRYAPANPGLDALAAESEALYAKSPNAVRRMIIAAANPGVAAFADAFKLRKD